MFDLGLSLFDLELYSISLLIALGLFSFFISNVVVLPAMFKLIGKYFNLEILSFLDRKLYYSLLMSIFIFSNITEALVKNKFLTEIYAIILVVAYFLKTILMFGVIFIVIYELERFYLKRQKDSKRKAIEIIFKFLKISSLVFIALYISIILGVDLKFALAFGGIWSIAIGFAAKNILSNAFALISIMMEKQFEIGDMICFPSYSIEGEVSEINWRSTVLKDNEGTTVVLPNSIIIESIIVNHSRSLYERVSEILKIEIKNGQKNKCTDGGLIELIENIINKNKHIYKGKPMVITLNKSCQSFFEISMVFFLKTPLHKSTLKIKDEIISSINDEIHKIIA